MEKFCARCKEKIQSVSNKQKYCRDCAYVIHLEKSKLAVNKKRQREEGAFGPKPIKKKDGSINIKAEQKAILREIKRLGLRTKYD